MPRKCFQISPVTVPKKKLTGTWPQPRSNRLTRNKGDRSGPTSGMILACYGGTGRNMLQTIKMFMSPKLFFDPGQGTQATSPLPTPPGAGRTLPPGSESFWTDSGLVWAWELPVTTARNSQIILGKHKPNEEACWLRRDAPVRGRCAPGPIPGSPIACPGIRESPPHVCLHVTWKRHPGGDTMEPGSGLQ